MFNLLNINGKVLLDRLHSSILILIALAFALTVLAPLAFNGNAHGAQLTTRSATIDQGQIDDTDVEFAFAYTVPTTTGELEGVRYQFCDAPLGACTVPSGMDVGADTIVHDAQTGWPENATAFAEATADENACQSATDDTFELCFERTTTAATGGGAVTHTISGITAPDTQDTVYLRIYLYAVDDFTTLVDEGIVAVAFVDQLTVTGRVQERLDFCVAAVDDAAALPADIATCTAITDTGVDIGVIDNSAVKTSPVDFNATTDPLADDDFGIAMVNTNASNGVSIAYYPETETTGTQEQQAFRVPGSTCNASGTDITDQCFISAAIAGGTIAAGTELFGMYISCIDDSQGTTDNLDGVTDAYDGFDDDVDDASADCENEANPQELAWNDLTTAEVISSSTVVVDDEIVKMRHAATASATTPTGTYTVETTYIATPTF